MSYNKINLQGLRQVLRKFSVNERSVSGTHWSIVNGNGDNGLIYELYYDRMPVVACVCGVVENNCLSEEDFKRIKKVIREEHMG